VRGGDPADPAGGVEQRHHAPVGQPGRHRAGHPVQGLLDVERRDQRLGQLGEHRQLALRALGQPARLLGELAGDPQAQLGRAGRGQILEDGQFRRRPAAWLGVDGTERAERTAVGVGQRHPRIRDHAQVGDGQVVAHLGVEPGVREDLRLALDHHVLAERVGQRRLALDAPRLGEADLAGEELPLAVDQRDQRHRHAKHALDQAREPVERLVGLGADADPAQRTQACRIGEDALRQVSHCSSSRRLRRSDEQITR